MEATRNKQPKKKAKAKTAKGSKQKETPNEPLVVFAFRIPKSQRDLIHEAAGPRNASRFVIDAALGAAKARLK